MRIFRCYFPAAVQAEQRRFYLDCDYPFPAVQKKDTHGRSLHGSLSAGQSGTRRRDSQASDQSRPPVCRTSHFTNADCAANDLFLSIRTYVLFVCCGNRSAAQPQTCRRGCICSRRSHFVFPPISVSALSDRCARRHPSGKLRRLVCHAMGMEKAEEAEKVSCQTIPHIITCTVDFRQCMFAFLDFYSCIWYTNTP